MSHPFQKVHRHPFESLAEWTIRLVASFSILLIFLIFIFVFRESISLFTDSTEQSTESQAQVEEGLESYGSDVPESYGGDVSEADNVTDDGSASGAGIIDESGVFIPNDPDLPEIYNPDTGELPGSTIAEASTTSDADPSLDAPISLWDNLFSLTWQPIGEQPKFGIGPLLIGTAKTTLIAILIGAPLGILAALYTAFFAPRRLREIIKPAIELLAGFPSVVIGFFCLITVASFFQSTFDTEFRLNALVGGVGLALAVIPIVYSIAEDSLNAVPKTLREASLALGSTEWQTAYKVMLPAAAPGVIAAVILGVGRAFGETMIAIMATGNAAMTSWSPVTPARTFAATIGSEMGEVVWGSEHYGILFLLGSLLFIVSFTLNALTEIYVKKRLIKRFQGK